MAIQPIVLRRVLGLTNLLNRNAPSTVPRRHGRHEQSR